MENEEKLPRGYILFLDLKLAQDMDKPVKYYIGMPMTKARADFKWVYTISRKHALIFRDNKLIGKFLSKFYKELKNVPKGKWNGIVYIQDVDSEWIVSDSVELNKFQP